MKPNGPGGPLWGTSSEELNATVVEWPPGGGMPPHVNPERDVVLVVVAGGAELEVNGIVSQITAGDVVVLDRGATRRITAGAEGVRYVTVHHRREGIRIGKA